MREDLSAALNKKHVKLTKVKSGLDISQDFMPWVHKTVYKTQSLPLYMNREHTPL